MVVMIIIIFIIPYQLSSFQNFDIYTHTLKADKNYEWYHIPCYTSGNIQRAQRFQTMLPLLHILVQEFHVQAAAAAHDNNNSKIP